MIAYRLQPEKITRLIIISALITSTTCFAEDTLEEIIVTAQKRTQQEVDVPISIHSIDSNTLNNFGISKIESLSNVTNNLNYTESGISTQVRIRGIGSGNSQGFEQSVAQYSDGVYYGRAPLFRFPIFDVKQVDVLRGPQNALWGKDSIAGAIAVTTAKTSKETEGHFIVGYTPQFGQSKEELAVTGQLSDSLTSRLSLRALDEDGPYENSNPGAIDPNREERSGRLKFDWIASDDLLIKTKIELNTVDVVGRQNEIVQDIPSALTLDLIARQPNNTTLKSIPSTFNNILHVLFGEAEFDDNANHIRQTSVNEYSNNEMNNFTTEGIYSAESMDFHLIASRIHYEYDENCECDYVPANIFTLGLNEKYTQSSLDAYLKSKDNSEFSWLIGGYYQDSSLHFKDNFFVPSYSFLSKLGNPLTNSGVNRIFSQDDTNIAVYGQIKLALTDADNIQIDGRITQDDKSADRSLNIVDGAGNTLNNALVTCTYLSSLKVETIQSMGMPFNCASSTPNYNVTSAGNDQSKDRTETVFSPSLSYLHYINEDNSLFASLKSGHKSGGFDPRSNSSASFEFGEEKSFTQELGAHFLNSSNTLQNNITIFHTVYKNLQVSQFDGGLGFNVGNAKRTVSTGIELDGKYLFTSQLSLNYGASYINIKFDDFKNGNCYQGQTPNGTDNNGDGQADLCDYSGKNMGFTPKQNAYLGIEYTTLIGAGSLSMAANAKAESSYNVHENLDPNGNQPGNTLLDAKIAYSYDDITFSLIGNNLTNQYIKTYASNVPLSGAFFGTNTLYAFAKKPRSVSINAEVRF